MQEIACGNSPNVLEDDVDKVGLLDDTGSLVIVLVELALQVKLVLLIKLVDATQNGGCFRVL